MRRRCILALVLVVASTLGRVPTAVQAQPDRRCFPDVPGITHCIAGRFRQYWEQHGGLAVFGYPITAATNEVNRDTGQTYLTQWFERTRFELHPENQPPYDVLLGRLGDDRLRQHGRAWHTLPQAPASAAHYFAQSGHTIAHPAFWTYWSTRGLEFDGRAGTSAQESLALFGLPLSEPQIETNPSGDTVLTQWFERARFEDHGPQGVLLGLLGSEGRGGQGGAPAASCTTTADITTHGGQVRAVAQARGCSGTVEVLAEVQADGVTARDHQTGQGNVRAEAVLPGRRDCAGRVYVKVNGRLLAQNSSASSTC